MLFPYGIMNYLMTLNHHVFWNNRPGSTSTLHWKASAEVKMQQKHTAIKYTEIQVFLCAPQ